MYKLLKNSLTNEINAVTRHKDGRIDVVPFDPANTDYAEYLKWLAEGNTPTPADEVTE